MREQKNDKAALMDFSETELELLKDCLDHAFNDICKEMHGSDEDDLRGQQKARQVNELYERVRKAETRLRRE